MEIYNTKYVCSYNNSDIFLESEAKILNDDEKQFVRDALYRRDLCNIFKIKDECFDEKIITKIINKLYEIIKGNKLLELCIRQIANNFYNLDLEFGFVMLFSFEYLYLSHPCICDFIETGKINEINLFGLQKQLF